VKGGKFFNAEDGLEDSEENPAPWS